MADINNAGNGIKNGSIDEVELVRNVQSLNGTVAGLCNRKFGADAEIRVGRPPCTDGTKIYLPVDLVKMVSKPGAARVHALGFITHELGHCYFTDMKSVKHLVEEARATARSRLDTVKMEALHLDEGRKEVVANAFAAQSREFLNCAEDPRIEYGMCRVFGLSARPLLTVVHKAYNPTDAERTAAVAGMKQESTFKVLSFWLLALLERELSAYEGVDHSLAGEYEAILASRWPRRMNVLKGLAAAFEAGIRNGMFTRKTFAMTTGEIFNQMVRQSKMLDPLLKDLAKRMAKGDPSSCKDGGKEQGSGSASDPSDSRSGSGEKKDKDEKQESGSIGPGGFQAALRKMEEDDGTYSASAVEKANQALEGARLKSRSDSDAEKWHRWGCGHKLSRREALESLNDPFVANNGDDYKDCNGDAWHGENPVGELWLRRLMEKYRKEISSLSVKLRRELVSLGEARGPAVARHGTRVAGSRIPLLAQGGFTRTPFQGKVQMPVEKTSIVILVDGSGSMLCLGDEDRELSRFDAASLACAMIGSAISRFEGQNLKLAVMRFDTQTTLIRKPGEDFLRALGRRIGHPMGSTEGYVATARAARMLMRDRDYRKIIITITDGIWDEFANFGSRVHEDDDCVFARNGFGFLPALGIEDYGIKIDLDFEPFPFTDSFVVHPETLAETIGSLLLRILRENKQKMLRRGSLQAPLKP